MCVESLNASAKSSVSSAKKIYASGEKENKYACWGWARGRSKGKEDGEKADGKNWKRTRTGRRGHDDGGLKGSGSAKKRWANKMHSYISGVCQNKWRCFVGDLFGRRLPPPVDVSQLTESSKVIDRRTEGRSKVRDIKFTWKGRTNIRIKKIWHMIDIYLYYWQWAIHLSIS